MAPVAVVGGGGRGGAFVLISPREPPGRRHVIINTIFNIMHAFTYSIAAAAATTPSPLTTRALINMELKHFQVPRYLFNSISSFARARTEKKNY